MASSKLARSSRRSRGEPPIRESVEVTAMLGDSILGVKHCMDPRGGRLTRATWTIAAAGLACLLASAIAFCASVRAAARDAAALDRHTRVLHRPAYAFRPRRASDLAERVVLGGLVLGLSALAVAHLRAGGERASPLYRIGTAPGVEQPLVGAPSERFPLVAPSGDAFVLNYAPGIEGELIAGGAPTPLSELAAISPARPSSSVPGAIEIPIPPAAQIRARVGRVTFLVSSVARPEPQAAPAPASAIDRRAVWYVAGSLAAHLGFVHVLYEVAVDEIIDGDFICYLPISDPGDPPEPDEDACQPWPTGCYCGMDRPTVSREEEIARAYEVALTGRIFGRPLLPRADAPELASADPVVNRRVPVESMPVERTRPYLRSVEGGALDKEDIERWLTLHEPQIDSCYANSLLVRPSVSRTVSVRFLIGPAGDVQRSSGEGFNATVASCVAAAISRIRFPPSPNGALSRVTSSFELRPVYRP